MKSIALVTIVTLVLRFWASAMFLDNTRGRYETDTNDDGRLPNWFAIFPGTKWCGAGNISANNEDLGIAADTDKCCRTHDFCNDTIEAGGTRHNLTNDAFYTRLVCDCDYDFYDCLKNVSSKVSNNVGLIYFNILGTQCFREDYPIVACIKYEYTPRKKCVEYAYDTTQDKRYQWFDVPRY
ncbi:hypothetical protein PPYR_14564 [Photinus pyralis]|uniref:Phospholipase A2 n=2 Tax=Photinus pyralis TaxID=7054 RepID=A0A5N4A5K5_PHOPY|nr:phospholipase A2-like [Photinus pyralis]KAB0792605.1 hypothetical protein PPYR_14564 [Photinus pyralis]